MKRIKVKPPYISLTQQKLCCVPCAIQWILLRRGLKLVEQEIIGRELDLIVPKKFKHLFIGKVKIGGRHQKRDYGTHETDGVKTNKFLKKYKIPLKAKKIFYSEFKDVQHAAEIIVDNLKKGNDMMIVTYLAAIWPKKKNGHAMLISEIILNKKPKIVVGEPTFMRKKFYELDLAKVIKGMDKKWDGEERGIYVFSKR